MWINWLLKHEGYPPGVVVALLLHGILMWVLLPKEFEPADHVRIEPASYMVASAVAQSPQKMRRIEQANQQRRSDEAARERQRQQQQQQQAERQRQQQAEADRQRQQQQQQQQQAEAERKRQEQAEADRQRQAEAERQRVAEENRRREADAERQRQADAQRQRQETAQREAADAAARAAAQQQQLSAENQMVSQYVTLIRDLVSGAWSRPPDARNGMVAIVQLRLTPTGEIINSEIVKSSGSPTFDRSVLQAIDRVGSFPELRDMPTAVFERNFRAINLEFSPEDLLR